MFNKRPKSAKMLVTLGGIFIVIALLLAPLALANTGDTTGRGVPIIIASPLLLLLAGAYYLVYGILWLRRGR